MSDAPQRPRQSPGLGQLLANFPLGWKGAVLVVAILSGVLRIATLGERRPIADDQQRIMLAATENANPFSATTGAPPPRSMKTATQTTEQQIAADTTTPHVNRAPAIPSVAPERPASSPLLRTRPTVIAPGLKPPSVTTPSSSPIAAITPSRQKFGEAKDGDGETEKARLPGARSHVGPAARRAGLALSPAQGGQFIGTIGPERTPEKSGAGREFLGRGALALGTPPHDNLAMADHLTRTDQVASDFVASADGVPPHHEAGNDGASFSREQTIAHPAANDFPMGAVPHEWEAPEGAPREHGDGKDVPSTKKRRGPEPEPAF